MLNRGLLSVVRRAAFTNGAAYVVSQTFSPKPLATSAIIFGAANAVGLGISVATGSHYHLDLIGTGIFSVAAIGLRGAPGELQQNVSAVCIFLWAVKLAGFLFYRALLTHTDARLDELLSSNAGAFGFWFISFAWGWIVSLPHALAAGVSSSIRPPFRWYDGLGIGIFAAGFLLETVADWQKWQFKKDPSSRGKFCDVGVWQLSQHPNWFGNFLLWSGICLLNASTLAAVGPLYVLPSLLSPLFLLALFYGQACGTISNTVELANAKHGHDPAYQEYIKKVPVFMPSPSSMLRIRSDSESQA
mmetsp:Transcript_58461/g.92631  ORF Transcript_58461/g.92631 Transcript_58461/m.92631 type:complete len:302 (-) Transcript_58461:74-979(-)